MRLRLLFVYNRTPCTLEWQLHDSHPMIDHFKLVQTLTDGPLGTMPHLDDFAFELGWKPSDHLSLPGTRDFATAHLIVEHGLDYTAVLSFLQRPYRFVDLTPAQQRLLASASYNSLIDWHISVDYDERHISI